MQTPEVVIPAFTLPTFVVTILVAALCGALAQLIVGYTHGGCFASLLVGFVGALVGEFIAGALHMPQIIVVAGIDVVWTTIGALVLVALMGLAFGGARYRGYYHRWRRRYY